MADPPTTVRRIKKSDKSKFVEYVLMPEVDIDDVIAKKTLASPSLLITKK